MTLLSPVGVPENQSRSIHPHPPAFPVPPQLNRRSVGLISGAHRLWRCELALRAWLHLRAFGKTRGRPPAQAQLLARRLERNLRRSSRALRGDPGILPWCVCVCVCVCVHLVAQGCVCVYLVAQSCPTLGDSMDCSPPGSSVYGDSPSKNIEVGCHALLQGIFPTQGLNPGLAHCR